MNIISKKELRDPEFIRNVANEIFKSEDVDESGYLEKDEIIDFLNEYFIGSGMEPPNPIEIDKIMKSFDINKDNKISLEEFTNMIKLVFEKISINM